MDQTTNLLASTPYAMPPYIQTSSMFNVGIERGEQRSLDVIGQDGSRYLVTQDRNIESERLISERLGDGYLPQYIGDDGGGAAVYSLPRSTLPLSGVFSGSTFSDAYMDRLHQKTTQLLDALHDLDDQSFGVTADSLAFVHPSPSADGSIPEDGQIFILPPLAELSRKPA